MCGCPWCDTCIVARMSDEPGFVGPDDATHRTVNDVIKGLRNRVIVPAARKALGDALTDANKPETGRLPDGAHRAPNSKAFGA